MQEQLARNLFLKMVSKHKSFLCHAAALFIFHLKPILYLVCVPHPHDQKTATCGVWKWGMYQYISPYLGIRATSAIN